jgi:trimeric autotransporter adhesin
MANIKRANTSGITKSGVAIPDVPDAPTIGAATNVGTSRAFNNGSATVAFTANARGGTSTSFTATSTPGGFTASGAGSPLTVTGLQSATSYTFAVTGTNTTATGAASAASSSITATTIPATPAAPTATNVGTSRAFNNGAASVAFTAPATGGSNITGYTVTSSPSGFTGTGSSSPITVTGLASATAYTYTITATNANGTSTASSASASVTSTTVPQAPTIGTATDGGTGTTVSVPFTAGATGGSAITGYTVTSSPGSITGTGASSPITVSGLTAGTAYTFTVTATNANGTSTASSASNSVTPVVPTAFDSIATINPTSGATTVTFSSIPQTYKSLQFRFILRTNNGASFNTSYGGSMLFNGVNSGSLYSAHRLQGTGAVAFAGQSVSLDSLDLPNSMSGSFIANLYAGGTIDILDYATTTKTKTIRGFYGVNPNSSSNSWGLSLVSGFLANTSAVTSITFNLDNLAAGSSIALYGIK